MINEMTYFGPMVRYKLLYQDNINSETEISVEITGSDVKYDIGEQVGVDIKPEDLYIFQ